MIRGIGVDVVDVRRMKEMLEEKGDPFIGKVFTESEIAYCRGRKQPHEHFAARFAAKEAVSKAIQTGWSGTFRWKDVEVYNEPSGAPRIKLFNETAVTLEGCTLHLSLSHTENTVVAFVVIEHK
ncbi:MAG: holo-[acyl-carrier-protein] synthase [Ignavibacteria bacterium]|nr:holo-[acyl-carrier-protein] synthase [Ignavibacteria bacterium]